MSTTPITQRSTSLAARLAARTVVTDSGCWLWQGARNGDGYGIIRRDSHSLALAHRVAYELHVGAIPNGLTIDHLCYERACVNPAHHEAVSLAENNRRRLARAARCGQTTHRDRRDVANQDSHLAALRAVRLEYAAG